jgi:hypothetical protein
VEIKKKNIYQKNYQRALYQRFLQRPQHSHSKKKIIEEHFISDFFWRSKKKLPKSTLSATFFGAQKKNYRRALYQRLLQRPQHGNAHSHQP